jgi:hypothetical protein
MTETRAVYDKPRQHYLRCECGHRLAFVTDGGVISSTVAADWRFAQGKLVIRCHQCGKWVKADTS